MAVPSRPSFLSQSSTTRRAAAAAAPSSSPFPSLTRGSSNTSYSQASSTPSTATVAPTWGPAPISHHSNSSVPTSDSNILTAGAYKKKGLSLSLASIHGDLSHGVSGNGLNGTSGVEDARSGAGHNIHPLFNTWDVWFSHRNANSSNGGANKKRDDGAATAGGKESREEWEGGVVKLGGFSSIESLHPFLAFLTPPSSLPSSISSSAHLFPPTTPTSSLPPPSNVISDINLFRSPISPLWEHPSNTGGGRIFLRLKKGVADRVWEEVVFALVGERIGGGESESEGEGAQGGGAGGKVNGAVLSVRKDEDILSLWTAPCSRNEREAIRESFRAALEPLLTATSLANLSLDYKPHPVSSHSLPHVHVAGTPHHNNRSEGNHHSNNRRNGNGNGENGAGGEHRERENRSNNNTSSGGIEGDRPDRRSHANLGLSGNSDRLDRTLSDGRDRPSRNGGFGYVARERGLGEERPHAGERSESYNRNSNSGNGERSYVSHTERATSSGGRPRRGSNADNTLDRTSGSALKESRGNGSWGRS